MEAWEAAAAKFIENWEHIELTDAIFLTGSYATGNATKESDIDIFIILNDSVEWRERGNRKIDGFLVEYFANPLEQVKSYTVNNLKHGNLTQINMFKQGKLLFDRNNTAEQVLAYCESMLKEGIPQMGDVELQNRLYGLWNDMDELCAAYVKVSPDFMAQYYRFCLNAFCLYSRFICAALPDVHHLYKWLADKAFALRYGLPAYPDTKMSAMMQESFDSNDTMRHAEKMYKYISDKTGGFDIEKYTFRSKCDLGE